MNGASARQGATASSLPATGNPAPKSQLELSNGHVAGAEGRFSLYGEDWESEKTLVAALSSLQQMETRVRLFIFHLSFQ